MLRAFGAFCSDDRCCLHILWRAEGSIYTSRGQSPRTGDKNVIEGLKARSIQTARRVWRGSCAIISMFPQGAIRFKCMNSRSRH